MKIEGLLNAEEEKEVKEHIKMLKEDNAECIESGFLGVKVSEKGCYDVYRIIAQVIEEEEE